MTNRALSALYFKTLMRFSLYCKIVGEQKPLLYADIKTNQNWQCHDCKLTIINDAELLLQDLISQSRPFSENPIIANLPHTASWV